MATKPRALMRREVNLADAAFLRLQLQEAEYATFPA